jgi:hypothetical protein
MGGFYTDESLLQIALVTCVIGGGAAALSGRAIASTWRPYGHVVGYMMILGAAVRFVHFSLFEGTLLSFPSYAADTLYLLLVGCVAWRITKTNQIIRQYDWLYEREALLTWRDRPPKAADTGGTKATPV